ncbi:non-ribosomal peptide synthetase [Mycolicibacter longobardus]|uniref:Non-ribosomal peptide synthetase n=1 Tax=Mycolicibacter longobardus TaxID=1108812 RepID=A0A1X1YIM5_9MYCO|nr:non-ribosomal peptide synthetase [Mycolicibacter longobardus]MCV7384951.1 non-ribosomal peptide synthetase [Mycolicibacter longobardus]ORW10952.1 non-ribosomal peptide synthetase [Mycolicibacter longobardus]
MTDLPDVPADLASLSPEKKRELLAQLLMAKAQNAASEHELSYGQRSMWFMHRLAPDSPAYTVAYAGRIRGGLDLPALERAAQALVDRHPMLRTTYTERDGQPVALVHGHWPMRITTHRIGSDPGEVDQWVQAETARPFDLRTGPVLRLTLLERPDDHVLLLTVHHIAVDFWSIDVILDELRALYAAEHGAPAPEQTADRYVDYAAAQTRMLGGPEGERLWEYWHEALRGELPTLALPTDRPRPAVQTYDGALYRFGIDAPVTAGLKQVARNVGATPYMTLLAAYAVLLHRYSGQDDLVIGSPFACRDRAGLMGMVGYVTNPLPLRVDIHDDPSFAALLGQVKDTVLGAIGHQEYPLPLLVERLRPVRDAGRTPLFQVSFAWQQVRLFEDNASDGSLPLETLYIGQGGSPFDITMQVGEQDDELQVALQYNTDLFDAATIEAMAQHFTLLLTGLAAPGAADVPVSQLTLLTDAERATLQAWNDTAVDYPAPACLHEMVAAAAARTPEAVAVSYEGAELSYRELDRRANGLAHRLRQLGVGTVTPAVVPVLLERSEDLVIALLGVLKAGGVFLPLDPAQPTGRLEAMLADVPDAPACVTHREHLSHVPTDFTGARLCLDQPSTAPGEEESAPETGTGSADLAYLMYTSGSTGAPKGALNSHAGIRNRLLWMQDAYQLTADDRVLHKTPINFDPFVWEIFWPLTVGARVVIAKPEGHKDAGYLARTIVEQRVTTMHFVPSMLRRFLAEPDSASCTGLRQVFCSGEALTADLRDAFFAALPAELYNLYGPTEAAIDVTHFHCERGNSDPIIPIGRPIANIAIHLLDAAGNPVPVGVPGELHIGGVGVGRGYLNRPEATAAAFLDDPFSDQPGALLYRTGDLARYRPDGNIEYLGRRDDQVKINGFRIELGEVEAALAKHPGIAECAVVARKDASGNTQLIAHIVPVAAAPGTADLRRFLLELLPAAMVPAVFRAGDLLPLSASGKVDRRALLALDQDLDAAPKEFVAPRDATEEALAQIWREVLDLDRVGVTDDFFALGGASTQALEVAVRVGELGMELRPESLFVYGTIAELASEFGPIGRDAAAGQPAERPVEQPAQQPAPAVAAPAMPKPVAAPVIKSAQTGPARNVVIESLGVYLPPRAVSTEQVLADCVNEVKIPLERLTGIKNRRMAGVDEFSIDLGRKAIADCLSRSSYAPEEIDLVIACNISRCDGPEHMFTFEPSTASQLRDQLGLSNAVCFDINNACAGMFTGVSVAQDFLKTGLVRNALVVSGEYISHITGTAQQEIDGPMDPRLACLTVGDAGAAAVLELGPNDRVGFHDLDLATYSEFAKLCIAKATEGPHGGAIMVTDSVTQTAIAVKHSVPYVAAVMQRHGWRPETADQLLMHQTSEASINDAILTINRVFGAGAASRANTICNLAERGNTATTTHFVALYDYINAGRINSGDNVVLSITGSGQTIGTGLYTFDDLPDRMRRAASGQPARAGRSGNHRRELPATPRVRIEGIGIAPMGQAPPSSIQFAVDATTACLEDSGVDRSQVGLVIHAGIYRDDFLSEPAVATLVAGEVGINAEPESADAPKTFAFDILNGAVGFLNGCHVAAGMIGAGRTGHAMVLASEVENNTPESGYPRNGIKETGSAIMLSPSHGPEGFGRFVFGHHPEYRGALATYTQERDGRTWLRVDRDPNLAAIYVSCLPSAVKELLTLETLEPEDIALVFPPYLPGAALDDLAAHIGVDRSRFVDLEAQGWTSDPFTSTLPYQIADARQRGLVKPGDVALILAVGSGVEVGCTTYRF